MTRAVSATSGAPGQGRTPSLASQQRHNRVCRAIRFVEVPHRKVPPAPVLPLVRKNTHIRELRAVRLLALGPKLLDQLRGVVVAEIVVVRRGLVPAFVRV